MRKPLTGEPHARFGGRGGRCPFLPLSRLTERQACGAVLQPDLHATKAAPHVRDLHRQCAKTGVYRFDQGWFLINLPVKVI